LKLLLLLSIEEKVCALDSIAEYTRLECSHLYYPWLSLPKLAALFEPSTPQNFFKGSKVPELEELALGDLSELVNRTTFRTHVQSDHLLPARDRDISSLRTNSAFLSDPFP
jgi:hypothetical protein